MFLILVIVSAPNTLRAEGQADAAKEKARTLVSRANRAFERADYRTAAESFLEAQRVIEANGLTPKPELLYNAGLAYERLDQCDKTAELYERFLAAKPDGASPDLKYRLKKAAECAPKITVTTDPGGAKVVIDGEERGVSPVSLRLGTGTHLLHLALVGYTSKDEEIAIDSKEPKAIARRLDLVGGAARDAVEARPREAVEPTSLTAATAEPEQQRSGWPRRLAWISGGAGVAAIGTGVVFAVLSQSAVNRRDAEVAKGTPFASDQTVRDEQDRAASFAWGRDISFGIGAVGLVASGILFLASGSGGGDRAELSTAATDGGARASWRLAW